MKTGPLSLQKVEHQIRLSNLNIECNSTKENIFATTSILETHSQEHADQHCAAVLNLLKKKDVV